MEFNLNPQRSGTSTTHPLELRIDRNIRKRSSGHTTSMLDDGTLVQVIDLHGW